MSLVAGACSRALATYVDEHKQKGRSKLLWSKLPWSKLPWSKLPLSKLPLSKLPLSKLPLSKLPWSKLPWLKKSRTKVYLIRIVKNKLIYLDRTFLDL